MAKTKIRKAAKDKPTKAEKQALKLQVRTRLGLNKAAMDSVIDENDTTLDAKAIADKIIVYLAKLPKG